MSIGNWRNSVNWSELNGICTEGVNFYLPKWEESHRYAGSLWSGLKKIEGAGQIPKRQQSMHWLRTHSSHDHQNWGTLSTLICSYKPECRWHSCFGRLRPGRGRSWETCRANRKFKWAGVGWPPGPEGGFFPPRHYSINQGFQYWEGEEVSGIEVHLDCFVTIKKQAKGTPSVYARDLKPASSAPRRQFWPPTSHHLHHLVWAGVKENPDRDEQFEGLVAEKRGGAVGRDPRLPGIESNFTNVSRTCPNKMGELRSWLDAVAGTANSAAPSIAANAVEQLRRLEVELAQAQASRDPPIPMVRTSPKRKLLS